MNTPNFLFIGPQKTGTTWIHEYLRLSGHVVLPRGVKETHFFDKYFDKGVQWYASHFKEGDRIVEVGASYFDKSDVPYRVKDVL